MRRSAEAKNRYEPETSCVPRRAERGEFARLHHLAATQSRRHQGVRGLSGVSRLPPGHLRPVADHVDGQRGAGSEATPEGDRCGFFDAESARHVQ